MNSRRINHEAAAARGVLCIFLDGGVPLGLWNPYPVLDFLFLQLYHYYSPIYQHLSVFRQLIPYSRLKLSDFYTLSQTKLLENYTHYSGTYPYSSCMRVPPTPHPHPRARLYEAPVFYHAEWNLLCKTVIDFEICCFRMFTFFGKNVRNPAGI